MLLKIRKKEFFYYLKKAKRRQDFKCLWSDAKKEKNHVRKERNHHQISTKSIKKRVKMLNLIDLNSSFKRKNYNEPVHS